MSLILVDSNILVYAINSASPKHKMAQDFLRQNLDSICVSHQNILETLRVLTHHKFPTPMAPKAALAAVMAIVENVQVITPDPSSIYIAQELIKRHFLAGDKIFDAYLAATTLAATIDTIATDNTKDFAKIPGIHAINPFN